ncbi:MAG: hypothetical protein ACLTMP_13255 [Eggerthella lenta]
MRANERDLATALSTGCPAVRTKPGQLVTREHVRNAIWDSAGEYVSDNTLSVYINACATGEDIRPTPASSSPCAGWATDGA